MCSHYYASKLKITPLCRTKKGCPIGDIAPDPKANDIVNSYLKAKRLSRATGLPDVQRDIFERIGLLKDADLLLTFEEIFAEYLLEKAKEQNG